VDVVVFNQHIVRVVHPKNILAPGHLVVLNPNSLCCCAYAANAQEFPGVIEMHSAVFNRVVIALIEIDSVEAIGAIDDDISECDMIGVD